MPTDDGTIASPLPGDRMPTHKFVVSVEGVGALTEAKMEESATGTPALFWSSVDGDRRVTAFVDAATARQAYEKLILRLMKVVPGSKPGTIERDMVNVSDIAARTNTSRETVRKWAVGERQEGFPKPIASIGQGRKVAIWDWHDVNAWLEPMGLADDYVTPAHTIAALLEAATETIVAGHAKQGSKVRKLTLAAETAATYDVSQAPVKSHGPRVTSGWHSMNPVLVDPGRSRELRPGRSAIEQAA